MTDIFTRELTQTDGTSPEGTPLTNAQVDTNFINLNDDKVEVSGAIIFEAKAGEALSKGDVVYVSGVSGNEPVVSKADANDASKMPAYGLAEADANLNAAVNVVTFGTLYDLNTSSFAAGDTVYVSTTAGAITTTAPTGESSLLQNIGTVIRSHASAGSIKVGGAGRTNATPNLNDGNVFIGNASNQAEARALTGDDISGGTITSFASTGIDDNATSTAVTINSSGNIGIGIDQPLSELHIKDSIPRLILQDTGNFQARYDFVNSSNYGMGSIRYDFGSNELRFYADGDGNLQLTIADNLVSMEGDLAVDTNTLFVDASTNRVGIGTDNPSSLLELTGNNAGQTVTTAANALRFKSTDPTDVLGQTHGAILWETSDTDNAGVNAYIGTAGFNNGLARLVFGTGTPTSLTQRAVIDENGNVGIGETDPDRILHIKSAVPAIRLEDTDVSGLYSEWLMAAGRTSFRVDEADTDSNYYIDFRLRGEEWLRVNPERSVRIGPSTATSPARFNITTDAVDSEVPASGTVSANAAAYFRAINNNYGLAIGTITSGASYLQAGRADGNTTNYNILLNPNGGRVGIGATSPASLVSGGDSPILSIGGTDTALTTGDKAGTLSFITNDPSFTNTYADGITGEIASVAESSVGGAYGLHFYTGTTGSAGRGLKLRIDNNGNVGIGAPAVSGASAPLDVDKATPYNNCVANFGEFVALSGYQRGVVNINGRVNGTDYPASLSMVVRNQANSNWIHGRIVYNYLNEFIIEKNGAGSTGGYEQFKIDAGGRQTITHNQYAYGQTNYFTKSSTGAGNVYLGNINGGLVLSSRGYYYGGSLRQLDSGVSTYAEIIINNYGEVTFSHVIGGTAGGVNSAVQSFKVDAKKVQHNRGTSTGSFQRFSGSITPTGSGFWIDIAKLNYSHTVKVQGILYSPSSPASGGAMRQAEINTTYGNSSTTSTSSHANGAAFTNLEFRYLNSGGSTAYILQARATYTGSNPVIDFTVDGWSTDDMYAL